MIVGIGIDIVSVQRIKRAIEDDNGERFLKRIYSEKEINYCKRKKNPYPSFAARFAGKEAFVKASSSILKNINYRDIEILNNQNNAPFVNINNKNFDNDLYLCYISLSYTEDYGCAVVTIAKRKV